MFIATAITNQSKLRRSEAKGARNIALLRSCKRKQMGIYKHFIPTGFMCSRNLLKKQEVRPLLRRGIRGHLLGPLQIPRRPLRLIMSS